SETGGTGTITWTLRLDGGTTPIFTTSGTASTTTFNWDISTVAPGAHRLDLTVQDGGGRTATATRNVTVWSPQLAASVTRPGGGGDDVDDRERADLDAVEHRGCLGRHAHGDGERARRGQQQRQRQPHGRDSGSDESDGVVHEPGRGRNRERHGDRRDGGERGE